MEFSRSAFVCRVPAVSPGGVTVLVALMCVRYVGRPSDRVVAAAIANRGTEVSKCELSYGVLPAVF